MDEMAQRDTRDDLGGVHMERSLKELQRVVAEHEEALNKIRNASSFQPKGQMQAAKASLDVMNRAYEDLTEAGPYLPFPGSVLPALLALRNTHRTIVESRAYLESQKGSVEHARRRLEIEQSSLSDQKALTKSLETRIQSLRDGLETNMEQTPEEIAQEKVNELKKQKRKYDTDTSKLMKTLNKFIDEHLGAMLAAEELGGPVVGDLMDIDTDQLEAGFSGQGKPKKIKENPDQGNRQRRIDDIWGGVEDSRPDKRKSERDEAAAAGEELRELTEQLLNSLMESAGDSSATYIKLQRESAAARFLVRSKVAQFHPKDATRLRLVDFGREIGD